MYLIQEEEIIMQDGELIYRFRKILDLMRDVGRRFLSEELLINNYLQNIPSCAILSSNISNCIGGKNGYTC